MSVYAINREIYSTIDYARAYTAIVVLYSIAINNPEERISLVFSLYWLPEASIFHIFTF